jgi:hypothetical protein
MVEHRLPKPVVAGSIPVSRSIWSTTSRLVSSFLHKPELCQRQHLPHARLGSRWQPVAIMSPGSSVITAEIKAISGR